MVESLRGVGLDALPLPLIEVLPAPDALPVRQAWEQLPQFNAVMFVSGNAATQFYALKPPQMHVFTAQAAIKTRAFVTGPGSLQALLQAGAAAQWIDSPDLQHGQFDSEALWAVVASQVRPGFRLLIVRGVGEAEGVVGQGHGRDWFADQVRRNGGSVEFVVAYQRRCPVWSVADRAVLTQAASDRSVWLFSSSEAIANLVRLAGELSWSQALAVATHPRIAQAAREAGFAVVCESRPTLQALVSSIESLQ